MEFSFGRHQFKLLVEKALYEPSTKSLYIADLHFGKAMHFRKSGMAVPPDIAKANWERFSYLLLNYEVEKVYLLGDLFHSDINTEWIEFKNIIQEFDHIEFHLVKGNHDVFDMDYYHKIGVVIHLEDLVLGDLLMTHEPLNVKDIPEDNLNLCGHIHPGVLLRGRGRQSLKLPCFYIEPNQMILPAFGEFTGLYTMEKKENSRLITVAGDELVEF